ncbi:CpsD/CapB family tyrosine-protein kinase [Brevibacillus sp. B_LB10_24]|uniref:CpsD/CapB family tyrosine-protein kinase n=1 Tax=Brevibacillus sp. B_LB10_24 TaxID=3380645 RepID=UPI0038B77759
MRANDRIKHLISLEDPKSPITEAYRTLRTNIQFASANKKVKTLLITSAEPNEGKTTTILNLAVVMAQSGQRVLLVDADMRKPTLHFPFPVQNQVGLSNLLIGQVGIEDVIQEIGQAGLHLITAGHVPPNPAELLESQRMNQLLEEVRDRFDMILFDSPPILLVTDAQVLSSLMDGVLLVISSGNVLGEQVAKAKNLIEHVGGHIIGTVLNRKKIPNRGYYYT